MVQETNTNNPDTMAVIRGIFSGLLKRTPSEERIAYYIQQGIGPADLIGKILQSSEYKAKQMEHILSAGKSALIGGFLFDDDPGSPSHIAPNLSEPTWQMCTAAQLASPEFDTIQRHLLFEKKAKRKLWDYSYIFQVLDSHNMIGRGRTGLGIGVGTERLPSYLASKACKVIATDQPPDQSGPWEASGQWAGSIDGIWHGDLCSEADFQRNVEYRFMDLTSLSNDLPMVDFIWSTSVIEHLGCPEKAQAFLLDSLELLKPGGIAVHTTELNLSSNQDTVHERNFYLFRRCDLESIRTHLVEAGCLVPEMNFFVGTSPSDYQTKPVNARDEPVIKLHRKGHVFTSYGLFYQKAF